MIKLIGEYLRYYGFWLLDFVRNNQVHKYYCDISKMLSDDEYYKKQNKEYLRKLLDRACNETEFYKAYKGVYDLSNFPVINKSIIREAQNDFLSNQYNINELHKMFTSGSTGTPLDVYQNKEKRNRVIAELLYFGDKVGYRVGKKLVFLRFLGEHERKSKIKQFIQNENLMAIDDMSKENLEYICRVLLKAKQGTTILGYASTLKYVIDTFKDMGIHKVNNISGIISGSEVLTEINRKNMREMFNCPIVSRYSNQENGVIAQDCDEYNEYHINRANYIVEILKFDSDEKAEEGEIGRIVITDLFNYAMPLIRYDTGDIASMLNNSVCRENGPTLANLEGRKLDMLYNTSGERLSFFAVDEVVCYLPYVKQYQIIQRTEKDYTIRLVCTEEASVEESRIILGIKDILGQDANIELLYCEGIPIMSSGKFKYVINLMNN